MWRGSASSSLQLPDISKIDVLGAQDERVYVEFSTEQLAGLGIDRAALIAALNAQNAVTPQGEVQTGDEKILVRVSGAFRSEQDILAVNFVANGRMIRLGDIARVTRGPADPAQPMFRVNGKEGIGLAIAMRTGGDVLALGRNVEDAMTEIKANLPVGVEPTLIADQPVTVEHAVDDFMEALWEAIAIVLAVSLLALGLRAGAVVALSIPLVLAVVFVTMSAFGDRPAAHLARRPHYRARPPGRRRHDHRRVDGHAARNAATRRSRRRAFAYSSTAFPRLAGTLVTIAAFVPDRFRAQRRGRIHLLDLRRRRHRADRVVVRRGPVYALAWRLGAQEAEDGARRGARSDHARLPRLPRAGDASPLGHDRRDARPVRRGAVWNALRSAAILSAVRPPRAAGRPAAARERLDRRDEGRLRAPGQASEGRSGRRSLEHLCRTGRRALLSAAERAAPERLFRADRDCHEGTRGARAREGEAGARAGDRLPERRRPRLSAGARAAGRMAAAIPGERTGAGEGARHRRPGGRARRLSPRRRERQLQLDAARPHDQDPGRPGPGPSSGSEFAGAGAGCECGRVRRHGHADAQRDLAGRRPGPGVGG